MKEKTKLINMRIPESILKKFDEIVKNDPTTPSRTVKIIAFMIKHRIMTFIIV